MTSSSLRFSGLSLSLAVSALVGLAAVACGDSSSTGDDGGTPEASIDAATDTTPGDAASDGGSSGDATADAPSDAGGTLDAGDTCELKNDQCGPGLKCCGGGAVTPDAGTGHCVVPTDGGTCPLVP